MANFDPKRVTPIEWAGIGAGVLAFLASFFPWYSVSVTGFGGMGVSQGWSAWSIGIGGWLPVLLLVAAGVLVFLPHVGTSVPNLTLLWLGFAAAAVVIIIIRWLTLSSSAGLGSFSDSVSDGAGFGLYIGLLAAIASAVAAFLTFQASKKPTAGPQGGYPQQPGGYPPPAA
ncbi:hypothetical protein V5P93_001776 [Actinokineospora auranticolor]|uniref:Uncharacterized protein n=1 Tax=Actinokineospora auranticolor TaxID=155976 RepID=A0A2S6GGQ0_9PSEU|nr:hypothetical protein [Actinokineospora auranticolor]PPK64380.1 hypothetical protein CLV40_120103 [Actinokineospora auranticolor]